MINLENVKRAVELQKLVNQQIAEFGKADKEIYDEVVALAWHFTKEEQVLFLDLLTDEDEGPEYDSAGFSVADRMEGWDDYIACTDQDNQRYEDSHHCDDLDCNCSI